MWTDSHLDSLRQEGDPPADKLAEEILKARLDGGGRLGYNSLLDLADVLSAQPELALVEGPNMSRRLNEFPEPLRDYYDPMPAPDWADPEKLRIGQEVWRRNPLPIIGVLYAASLPACYLIKNGIPALYQTDKLRDQKYIFQRIYETGLMLQESMDPDGGWSARGSQIVRESKGAEDVPTPSVAEVRKKVAEVKQRARPGRYLWGRGYLAAKKVRLLHASMRYMLQHKAEFARPEDAGEPQTLSERIRGDQTHPSWPTEEKGVPVNQEDLAYTLLTFAYLLPHGLTKWGCRLSRAEKEGFLHLWKVIGHMMGVREDLLTDDWDEAESLLNQIKRLQGGHSDAGEALTEAVMKFLETFLPRTFGIGKAISAALIVDQLGWDTAKELLPREYAERVRIPRARLNAWVVRRLARAYYFFYQRVMERIPLVSSLMRNIFYSSSTAIIRSWRDAFWRKPFYIPLTYDKWQRKHEADASFEGKLHRWRERVFLGVVLPLLTYGATTLGTVTWLLLHFFGRPTAAAWAGWAALASFAATLILSEIYLPSVLKRRPRPDDMADNEAVAAD